MVNVDPNHSRGPSVQPKPADTKPPQIEVSNAHLKCMIDDVSGMMATGYFLVPKSGNTLILGVLVCATDPSPKLCYFEIEDLNVVPPVDYLDVVMLLNRMAGVKVQFQARLIDEQASIPYVTHLKGVQLSGHIPSFMAHVKVQKADKSKFPSGLNSEKVHR